jgi:hypothetical protein
MRNINQARSSVFPLIVAEEWGHCNLEKNNFRRNPSKMKETRKT